MHAINLIGHGREHIAAADRGDMKNIRETTKACGMSPAAFCHYLPNKDAFAISTMQDYFIRTADRLDGYSVSGPTAREVFKTAMKISAVSLKIMYQFIPVSDSHHQGQAAFA
jgi:hypothetical protein